MEDIFDLTQLREKAAKKINVDELKIETLSNDEIKKIFHELKVHEIELQLQNEELRNAQLNLEDKKNQYFKLFNNAPNGYAILDSNGLIVQANLVLQEMFGCDLPNLFDKPFNSFLLPNDSNKFLSNYQSFFKNPNGKIYKFKTPNKIIQIFGKLDHFAKSKTNEKMLFLTVVDVTQIDEANSQIAENSKLYRSIIQDSLEGFWLINNNGNFLDVNEAASKMLGYTKEEIIKLDITEIVVKKEFKNFEEQITETSKLINHKFNSKLIRKDKHIIEVEVSLSSIAKNGKNVIVGFIRDISEEVRSKQILKKRIELAEYSANHTVDEVMQKALDFAEELTNSKISFWHHIAEDDENISLQQWSTNTKNENCTAQNESHHANISSAGIWADCIRQRKPIIHNNYQNLEIKNDLPHGHAHLIRQVIVPVFKKNKIVAIIGIGNKPTDYVKEDVSVMEIFGNVAWTIYEKQFANETLIKSEQKNKAILGLLPDLLFEYSLNGTFLNYHCSDYSKLFLPPEKFMGKNVCDVLQPNIANLILKKINEAVSSNNMVSFEYSSNIGDMFQYFAVRIVQFTKNSVLCFMRDITEKQIAKELIIESEEKFSKVFFNSPLLKTINEIKTDKFVDINNKFLEITGFTKEETLGKTAVELGLLTLEVRKNIYKELDEKGSIRNYQTILNKKDGSKIICSYTCEVVQIAGKNFLLTIAEDITQKIKAEEELNEYKNKLEKKVIERTEQLNLLNKKLETEIQKTKEAEKAVQSSLQKEKELNEMKSQFMSMASHEFRTPLTTILSASELIAEYLEYGKKEKVLHHNTRIQTAVNKLIFLLGEVLNLSKAENAKFELNPSPTNIINLINKIIEESEHNKKVNQKIIFHSENMNEQFNVDEKLLSHILTNLINNSIKFSHDDSTINVSAANKKDKLFFNIKDNGLGINENDLKKLFEPFFRGENAEGVQGSGLGLSVVKSFVSVHKGEINVSSKLGEGTNFEIIIPTITQ